MRRYIERLSLGIWLGSMIFFAGVFAPRVFKVLERADAARLQANIFPPYFTLGLVLGFVLIICSLLDPVRRSLQIKKNWILWFLVIFSTATFAYSLWYLTPTITQLQSQVIGNPSVDPAIVESFQGIHRLSVRLNGAVLFSLLGLLYLFEDSPLKRA